MVLPGWRRMQGVLFRPGDERFEGKSATDAIKTVLADAAALMVTTLLMNERPRAEFLLVAPTVSLAHIAFSQALGMVDKDPDGFLRKRLHVQEHLRKITDRRTKATLEIKAFDTTVLTGVKPNLDLPAQSDAGLQPADLQRERRPGEGRRPPHSQGVL